MSVSSPKQADTAALETKTQAVDHHKIVTDTDANAQTLNHSESAAKSASQTTKQVKNSTENTTHTETDAVEPEQEQDVEMKQIQTPDKDEELSVISSDVSPHDSDFDFCQINSDSNFSLLTPSRHQDAVNTELTSPHLLSSCGSSGVCSPSKFFKFPIGTSVQTLKTSQRQNAVPIRLTTPKRLLEAIDSLYQQEEQKNALTPNVEEASAAVTLDNEQEIAQELIQLPAESNSRVYTTASSLDVDDIHCVPSGSLTSLSEHDSFFSFANSLSPLMSAEEFETSFMPMKLSPLVSRSYELPRLLPPFPNHELYDDRGSSSTAHTYNSTSIQTPKNKPNGKRGISSAASLAGGGISAPIFASGLVSPNFFAESFPNIQASTSATPGQNERSKLGSHSVMKLKLHTSFGPSPSVLDSHPTREIQAINNSLKRKKYIRRRNGEDKRPQPCSSSNVQRKLLQTPVKSSTSPHTITRSPLHPWNGQTSQANILKTPTAWKVAPSQQTSKVAADETPLSPTVTHRLVPATDPIPAPTTPVGNTKKRKASQCVSMPSSMANIIGLKTRKSPLDVRQAAALAVTPVKQIKREVTTTPDKYSMLPSHMTATCGASDMVSFDSSMLKTPTHFGSSTSLTTSLQSTSKPLLDATVMVIPSQVSKKAPCNCKKSKCLKLYCECFRLGGYCGKSCNCFDCANTTATEEVRQQAIASRLEKNPNAFKPKIGATPAAAAFAKRGAHRLSVGASGGSHVSTGSLLSPPGHLSFQQQQQILSAGLTTTKMHKHGCHCKKSACQKKYCECFQAGVPCGDNCRCIDCKNQTPCVVHGNGIATAESAFGGTPSRIANELDETFVSPVLQNTRQRMRIDRETWKKDFSSPFEASPGRERDRTERLQSRLLASRSVGADGTRMGAVSFMPGSTPQANNQMGAKRSLGKMSPVRGQGEEQRGGSSEAASTLLFPKECKLQQYPFADRIDNTIGKASSLAVVRSSAGTERVFVLPLFGATLPPLENGVTATIFCFLTNADLHNASLVSHLWNQVALGDTVWDHANFIPTRKNGAAGRCSRKKNKLETLMMKLEPSVVIPGKRNPMVAIKHEHNFAMLSTLR